jgi:hypothetical protein
MIIFWWLFTNLTPKNESWYKYLICFDYDSFKK